MKHSLKIALLFTVVALVVPFFYAQKVLDWMPARQSGDTTVNLFSSFSTSIASIALQSHNSNKDTITPGTGAPTPTPTQIPTPVVKPFVVPAKPYRFLLVGDSSMAVSGGFGDILEQKLITYPDVVALRDGKVSSGLSRPDYFDWNKEARADVTSFAPNITVVMIGDNDAQGLTAVIDGKKKDLAYGTASWDSEYIRRVQAFAATFTDSNSVVWWVGLPAMRDAYFAARIRHINSLQQEALRGNGMVRFISSEDLLAGPSGSYQAFLPDQQGVMRATRNGDGIHLSYFGGTVLADKIIAILKQDLDLLVTP